jgi:hypothetical protein
MLTQPELEQIKAALDMLNPDDVVRKVYPDIVSLLKTFTEEKVVPAWNGYYGGPGSHLGSRGMSDGNTLLCSTTESSAKTLIEDTPAEGGSLS